MLGLELAVRVGALRFQVLDRTVFIDNVSLYSVHAGGGQKHQLAAAGSAGSSESLGPVEIGQLHVLGDADASLGIGDGSQMDHHITAVQVLAEIGRENILFQEAKGALGQVEEDWVPLRG